MGVPVSTPALPAVVVHIPHASLVVPSDVAVGLLLTPVELQHELVVMTDPADPLDSSKKHAAPRSSAFDWRGREDSNLRPAT